MEREKIGECKSIMVEELTENIRDANFYLSNYTGLKADQINELRRLLEPYSAKYLVLKNSIAKIALKNAGLSKLTEFIDGGMGMILVGGDPIAAARVVAKFSKSHQSLRFKGGYLDGEVIDIDKVKYIASLPSKKALMAKVVFGIASPLYNFVNILANTLRSLIYAIQAIKEKK